MNTSIWLTLFIKSLLLPLPESITWVVVEAVVDFRRSMEKVSNPVSKEAGHHGAVVTLGVLVNPLAQTW